MTLLAPLLLPLVSLLVAPSERDPADAFATAPWIELFDRRSLEDFEPPTRDGKWEVRDGVLTGFGGPGVLATRRAFDDFILTTKVRVADTGDRRGNSGIFIRSSGLTAFRGRWPDGPEIQVDHGDPQFWTGSIFRSTAARPVETRDGEWCRLTIEAVGPLVRVWVDGRLVTVHHQAPEELRAGPIALQVHHPTDLVEFSELRILPLRSS